MARWSWQLLKPALSPYRQARYVHGCCFLPLTLLHILNAAGTDSFSTLLPSQRLDAFFDIGSYCGGYAARALAILAVEGCVLRLVSFLALQLCALSFTIDPLKLLSWFKSLFFRKGRWVARKPSPGHGV